MNKYIRISIAAMLISLLILFSACTKAPDTTETSVPTEAETPTFENALDALRKTPDLPYIQSVTVPYKQVYSPVLCGNILYMAVAKSDRSETDTNRLVAYNIETGKEELLFTSKQELANMQSLQTDGKWLVWIDLALYGGECNIYMMDMQSREITRVNHFTSEAPSCTSPIYMDGKIYWIEEEKVIGDGEDLAIYGHVYVYDCLTKKKTAIAEVHNIYENNLQLAAKDGKVIWFERIGEVGAYYIYDVESGKTDTIPSKQPDAMNIQYTDGYIFATETENFKERTPKQLVCVNIQTKEITELLPEFSRFDLSNNYLIGFTGSVVWFYSRSGNSIECLPEIACSNFSDYQVNANDEFIIVEQNEGINKEPFKGLKDEITVRIYKLSERS
ncbi:MAG: hypothetical protein K1V97_03295 [Lachnospiraceae bacterium]